MNLDDEKTKAWLAEYKAHYDAQIDRLLKNPWAVGFKDRGMGRGDFAVLIEGTNDVVVECPNKEVAEHLVKLHNAPLV